MKISIITVNLNNKEGLKRTIESVVNQTYQDLEYIIIDGDSTDGSLDVIHANANRLTYWVSETDRGIYNAMNKGIHAASGEYLLFLNSGDSLFHNTILEQAFPHLGEHSFVYGNLRFDHLNSPVDYEYPDQLTFRYFYHQSLGHPATFINGALFNKIGLYDEEYPICADWVFFTKAICSYQESYKHIPLLISRFDMTGISNVTASREKILHEKSRFLTQHFGCFYTDYQEYELQKQQLARIKSSKIYKMLNRLGLKKFI